MAYGLIALAGKKLRRTRAFSVLDADVEVCLNAGSTATGTRSPLRYTRELPPGFPENGRINGEEPDTSGPTVLAANRRYLEFISAIEDDRVGTDKLNKISQPMEENDRAYRGFNFFDPEDEELFEVLGSGEFNISGFQNKDLRRRVEGKNTGQISRLMKRLRTHGLIKKIGRTYKYYLTSMGKQVIALGLKLKNLYVIPELSAVPAR